MGHDNNSSRFYLGGFAAAAYQIEGAAYWELLISCIL